MGNYATWEVAPCFIMCAFLLCCRVTCANRYLCPIGESVWGGMEQRIGRPLT